MLLFFFFLLQRTTLLGEPTRIELLGHTEVPYPVFLDYIIALGDGAFATAAFCPGQRDFNSFSAEVAQFLCGAILPEYLSSPIPGDLSAAENSCLAPILAADSFADPDTGVTSSSSVISFAKGRDKRRRCSGEEDLSLLELEFRTRTSQREPSPELDELDAEIEALKYEKGVWGRHL